jgi:hypothetical protein
MLNASEAEEHRWAPLRGAHRRSAMFRLPGGSTASLGLGTGTCATSRGTREPAARVDTAHALRALGVRPARAEPEVAAGPHEELADAHPAAGVYPAVAVPPTLTRDRKVARRRTAAGFHGTELNVLGERRGLDAGEDGGRPGDCGARADPFDHPSSGDAFFRFELLWTHELTSSHLSTSRSGTEPENPEPASAASSGGGNFSLGRKPADRTISTVRIHSVPIQSIRRIFSTPWGACRAVFHRLTSLSIPNEQRGAASRWCPSDGRRKGRSCDSDTKGFDGRGGTGGERNP